MADSAKAVLIERLFQQRRAALYAFFRRRIRTKPEALDLTQEVYLRMLRLKNTQLIRNPEAYLFTVANNLVKEQAVLESRHGVRVDLADPAIAAELTELPLFEGDIDIEARLDRLRDVLAQLSPKCQQAVALQFRQGLTYEQIGLRLGISKHMAKKYLVQALAHCRRRMGSLR